MWSQYKRLITLSSDNIKRLSLYLIQLCTSTHIRLNLNTNQILTLAEFPHSIYTSVCHVLLNSKGTYLGYGKQGKLLEKRFWKRDMSIRFCRVKNRFKIGFQINQLVRILYILNLTVCVDVCGHCKVFEGPTINFVDQCLDNKVKRYCNILVINKFCKMFSYLYILWLVNICQ